MEAAKAASKQLHMQADEAQLDEADTSGKQMSDFE